MGEIKPSRVNRVRCKERDKKCLWCGGSEDLTPHHIIHTSQGGKDFLWNLIALCIRCHTMLHRGIDIQTNKKVGEGFLIIKLLKSYIGTERFRWQPALDWWLRRKNEKREK